MEEGSKSKIKSSQELENLKQEMLLLREINDANIDQIIVLDQELDIVSCNKLCSLIWKLEKKSVKGKSFELVFSALYDCAPVKVAINNALKGFKSLVQSSEAQYGKGYFDHHFVPLSDGLQIKGILIIIHDVAHRVKNEMQLQKLNKAFSQKNIEIARRNAELVMFAKITAHDLKEPQRKIQMLVDLIFRMDMENLNPKIIETLERIEFNSRRMSFLTEDIISFTQLNNFDKLRIEYLSLKEILDRVVCDITKQKDFPRSSIVFDDKLPYIKGNRKTLKQLFHHIIYNGLKFQPEDSVPLIQISFDTIEGSAIDHSESVPDVSYNRIFIEDNGIGIEQEYYERIFEIFQRLHTTEYPGTGIGLAISKKISEMHKGFITVGPAPTNGTIFTVYFPASDKDYQRISQK